LVWFKRDLRTRDHAPLAEAAYFEQALGLVVIEPDWLRSPECDARHVRFYLDSTQELQRELAQLGMTLLVRVGSVTDVLTDLRLTYRFTHLLSHEETGSGWSYSRDLAVGQWCRAAGVAWSEWPQSGVIRRLRSRLGWATRWAQRMNAPPPTPPRGLHSPEGWQPSALPSWQSLGLPTPCAPVPAAGESAAWATLDSFLAGRGRNYRRGLSSPSSAQDSCSRLSAHLAFGTISMRSVHQATEARIHAGHDAVLTSALRAFSSRLRWHCHFMQKLEDDPTIEFRNLARTADGLRPGDGSDTATPLSPLDLEHLQAWREGRTGFAMVDACMRQLRATGWLNFRMRAMLVSFAAYHLWLHWREPGLFLARQFLDFEPGIHWSQMQMQSGTTGINTLRIYSPAKQAQDHDPSGDYIRTWVPEFGSSSYPAPIVNEPLALARAKERLYGLRRTEQAQAEAASIQDKHGSRKGGLPPTTRPKRRTQSPPDGQGQLF
jgi:deoxyribodipyrimidine photo-lyase